MSTPTVVSNSDGLWVISKPSGWVVHPTNDPSMSDLVTWATENFPEAQGIAPIHRIDRHTSGLVLMSPDPTLRADAGAWFAHDEVQKEYRALVYGPTPETGRLDKPLKDARRGKPLAAVTEFQTLETFVSCSYLSVRPLTGRKHQIRRHLHGIDHAIVGEKRYRPRKFLRVPGFPGRLWLHATHLELPDGQTFSAPLPPELEDHLALLRSLGEE
jgi:tRNA pseudouridine65 synthase